MGAWFSSEEVAEATSPAPSPCKSSPPLPEHVLDKTITQLDGAHAALAARALPHTWPCQARARLALVALSDWKSFHASPCCALLRTCCIACLRSTPRVSARGHAGMATCGMASLCFLRPCPCPPNPGPGLGHQKIPFGI